jgi:hypothetical protein
VNGDREHLLGMVLTDHIVIKDLADFLRRRDDAIGRLTRKCSASSTQKYSMALAVAAFSSSGALMMPSGRAGDLPNIETRQRNMAPI